MDGQAYDVLRRLLDSMQGRSDDDIGYVAEEDPLVTQLLSLRSAGWLRRPRPTKEVEFHYSVVAVSMYVDDRYRFNRTANSLGISFFFLINTLVCRIPAMFVSARLQGFLDNLHISEVGLTPSNMRAALLSATQYQSPAEGIIRSNVVDPETLTCMYTDACNDPHRLWSVVSGDHVVPIGASQRVSGYHMYPTMPASLFQSTEEFRLYDFHLLHD